MREDASLLLIEDSLSDSMLISEQILMSCPDSVRVERCTSLTDGLEFLHENDVDGVLLDLNLPDSSGLTTFTKLQESSGEIPIVVLTGNDDRDLGLRAVRAGAQDFVVKGTYTPDELATTLDYAFERRQVGLNSSRREKAKVVGQLTAGMASDFRQHLSAALVHLNAIEKAVMNDPEMSAHWLQAVRELYRGANLTKQLLASTGQSPLIQMRIDVNKHIDSTRTTLARIAGDDNAISYKLDAGLSAVAADPIDLEAVLKQLVRNACESRQGGVTITVTTGLVVIDPDDATALDIESGEYLAVVVGDDGEGMPPDIVRCAADPYFSTKQSEDNKGLGLTMAESFARHSGGALRIESTVGEGTSIEILIPVSGSDRTEEDEIRVA